MKSSGEAANYVRDLAQSKLNLSCSQGAEFASAAVGCGAGLCFRRAALAGAVFPVRWLWSHSQKFLLRTESEVLSQNKVLCKRSCPPGCERETENC